MNAETNRRDTVSAAIHALADELWNIARLHEGTITDHQWVESLKLAVSELHTAAALCKWDRGEE